MADNQTELIEPTETLSPRDESRLQLAGMAAQLSDQARELVPVESDPEPGSLLTAALELRETLDKVVAAAAVAERERGVTWEKLAKAAGMTRQSAHQRWHPAVGAWSETGRRTALDHVGLALARYLDSWVAGSDPGHAVTVSSGLDAVRFPGSDAYENHQRNPSEALRQRLQAAQAARATAWAALNELQLEDGDSGVDHPVNHEVVATLEELVEVYEELAAAEPTLAEDHRASADWYRDPAERFRREGPNP